MRLSALLPSLLVVATTNGAMESASSQQPGATSSPVVEGVQDVVEGVQDSMQYAFETLYDSVEDIIDQSTLAGQITPVLQKFRLSPENLRAIWSSMTTVAKFADVGFLLVVGYLMVPSVRYPYDYISNNPDGFRSTKSYHVIETLSQMARLALVVYLVDMFKIFLVGLGFNIPRGERVTHAFAYVTYTVWVCRRVSVFKRYMLCRITGESEGRLQVVNRLCDAGLYALTAFIILDILDVEMGLALKSMAAFGSLGTLTFTLASQGIAKQLLHGILLSASDRIYEGDSIMLGKSNFSGTVAKLGWVETVLRGSDETMLTISNADLVAEKVSNLSRVHQSRVKQVLRFHYDDVEKLPTLFDSIKREIRRAAPSVITDGSRPFRCFWTNFEKDHLEVTVEAYFRVKPIGDEYWENKQRVLQAINKAVKMNDMKFVK